MPAPSLVEGKVWTAVNSGSASTHAVGPSTLAAVNDGALVALFGARDDAPASPASVVHRSAADGGATFSQPYTRIGGVISGVGTAGATVVDLWYLPNPDSSVPGETVATLASDWEQIFGIVAQFRNVDQTAPIGDTDSSALFSNTATNNHTTERDDSLLIAGVAHRHGDTAGFAYDADSTGIAVADVGPSVTLDPCAAMFYQPAPAAGAYSLTAEALDSNGDPPASQRFAMFSFELFGATGGADATATPTGVSGAGQVGSVMAGAPGNATAAPAGPGGAGAVGSVRINLSAAVVLTGVSGAAMAGTVTVFQWTEAPGASGAWAEEDAATTAWTEVAAASGDWT